MNREFEEEIARRNFEYGNHQILVTVTAEYTKKRSYNIDYGSGRRDYYRTVCVRAYPEDVSLESVPQSGDDPLYDLKEETVCRIREEPKRPGFEVPDDPDIKFHRRFLAKLSSEKTVQDLKEQKKNRLKNEWAEEYEPSGPAIELYKQLEETVRPVLEELDFQYQIVGSDVQVDIDVTIEQMEAEVSWAEIDTEIEALSKSVPES